jgi:hypothetical protein
LPNDVESSANCSCDVFDLLIELLKLRHDLDNCLRRCFDQSIDRSIAVRFNDEPLIGFLSRRLCDLPQSVARSFSRCAHAMELLVAVIICFPATAEI